MLARRETVAEGEIQIHHCHARCVRRAFLCGFDAYSGRDYEHRRGWVEERIKFLAGLFGVDVITQSVMSNHLHVILRTRPDRVAGWDDLEVARRWRCIFPGKAVSPEAARAEARVVELIATWRRKLSSLSWFMKCLDEYIARKANAEDGVTGHFWDGRFKNQVILDEASLLACMAYVDLNPIRAAMAETLEGSAHTGVRQRLAGRQAKARVRRWSAARKAGTTIGRMRPPLTEEQRKLLKEQMRLRRSGAWLAPLDRRARLPSGRSGVLRMTTDEYLELLDWTGREIRSDKRGAVPAHLAPVLKRLSLDVENWVNTVQRYGSLFWRVAGRVEQILAAARHAGRRWLKGVRAGQEIFAKSQRVDGGQR